MKRFIIILILFCSLNSGAFSQVNYLEFKDRYALSCSIDDSLQILANQHLVDSLFELNIGIGESEFLYHHGWLYFMRYQKWNDIQDLKISASSFEKGWEKYHDLAALWNLGAIYKTLGNCDKALYLTELYVNEAIDKAEIDYQQVYYRYRNCRKKE